MPQSPNKKRRRKRVNLLMDAELLGAAHQLGCRLSQELEHRLRDVLKEARGRRWLEENREAIAAYNVHVQHDGLFEGGRET